MMCFYKMMEAEYKGLFLRRFFMKTLLRNVLLAVLYRKFEMG